MTTATGFFVGANTTEVSHPLILDLKTGDSLYGISANGEKPQLVYLLAYIPLAGT